MEVVGLNIMLHWHFHTGEYRPVFALGLQQVAVVRCVHTSQ